MASSLVDSNVIIDVVEGGAWSEWSETRIIEGFKAGPLVINQIIVSETAMYFDDVTRLEKSLSLLRLTREDLPWEAAIKAGLAHAGYRRSGGNRDRVLPDFLIGAHADMRGHRLITRDPKRYRNYFPDIEVIAPDTHP